MPEKFWIVNGSTYDVEATDLTVKQAMTRTYSVHCGKRHCGMVFSEKNFFRFFDTSIVKDQTRNESVCGTCHPCKNAYIYRKFAANQLSMTIEKNRCS